MSARARTICHGRLQYRHPEAREFRLSPTTIAAPSSCAGARCKARSTTSTCRSNTRQNSCSAAPTVPAVRTLNKDFDGAIADFAAGREDRPGRAADRRQPLHHLRHDGQVRPGFRRLQRPDPEAAQETFAINNRAEVNVLKGDLDAALKDYNTVDPAQSEQCARPFRPRPDLRAQEGSRPGPRRLSRGGLFADEVRRARRRARPRHRAGALGRADPAGAGRVHGAPRGARDRQRRLQERPRLAESAARRENDRRRAARCRLPDRDIRQRPDPRQVLRGVADVCRRSGEGGLGGGLLRRPRFRDRRRRTISFPSMPSLPPTGTRRPRRSRWSR